ncbi:DUF1835 domain-containing protein [Fulvivirga lutimaris]|uniref:DUF1835 domain-containing protein n=1 Tax=Fulvivirga lutimaris TaxID=1819566 RepID=UPI0012BB6FEC|nr:DUF1835 domain-containing protein [Fulvivirga lutimaris]MTI38876.1 DUF1835 domain-containing protein [Fulvivirga lutimaris]
MANRLVHILNGDALKSQVENWLAGELIVARECLVDGDDYGTDIESLYACRAKFISSNYEGTQPEDYYKKTVCEIEKIRALTSQDEIMLWFEDDVFCQVNFWFCIHLLYQNGVHNLSLVRPEKHTQYGFGGLQQPELEIALKNRLELNHQKEIAALWEMFKARNVNHLNKMAVFFNNEYPFISNVIDAFIRSIPTKDNPGEPVMILKEIMKDLNTQEFSPIFREFSKRAPIYGYGDLQVKRLLDKLI